MRFILMLVALAGLSACAAGPAPLEHAHSSADSLARAVLDAIERRDLGALNLLAVSEREFQEHIWPELPAARPERNLPLSYVWGDLHQKSDMMLRAMLAKHGGQKYVLRSVRFTGPTTSYETYLVHRDSELTVVDASGAELRLRLFGSMLENDGRVKVFSYMVDD
jgi:hypothetical protein